MKDLKIYYTPQFQHEFSKLPQSVKQKAFKKEKIFRTDPHSQILKTHKLTGVLKNYWSFSIDYHYRVVFRYINDKEILFVDVGTHEVYKI